MLGAATLGVLGAMPAPAEAGTYKVLSCDDAPNGETSGWATKRTGTRISADKKCPSSSDTSGLIVASGGGSPDDARGELGFDAPSSTRLVAIDAKLKIVEDVGYEGDIRTESGIKFSGPTGSSDGRNGTRRNIDLGRSQTVTISYECVDNGGSDRQCGDPDSDGGHAAIYGARIEIENGTNPDLQAEAGSLGPNGPAFQQGEADVVFDANDDVGIQSARLLIDGEERDSEQYSCDYTKPVPCEDQDNRNLSFDTREVRNGTHTARLVVVDTADNEQTYNRAFVVRNDVDGDAVPDDLDNCPEIVNPNQRDADDDGTGDACDSTPTGGSSNGGGGAGSDNGRGGSGGGGSGGGGSGGGGGGSDGSGGTAGVAPLNPLQPSAVGDYVTLTRSPRVVGRGRSVTFSGRVVDAGLPSKYTLVALQARVGREWVTFKLVRSDALGAYAAQYRFKRTRRSTRYQFRAHVAAQATMGTVDSRGAFVRVR